MSSFRPDVDRYLRRIGFAGRAAPTLACLAEIQRRHTQSIPFENLDVLAGQPIPLDGASLERKLVDGHRGGYCFEQNNFALTVLREIGFEATPFLARVRWTVPPGVDLPRTHLVIKVAVDGTRQLFDVAFGSLGITAPVSLDTEEEQRNRDGLRRIRRRDLGQVLQSGEAGLWADVYEIAPDPAVPADWEMANWFTSTHPQSRFRQNLIVARSTPEGRSSLFNRDLVIRRREQEPERRTVDSPDDLLAILSQRFDLHFESGTRFGRPGSAWPA